VGTPVNPLVWVGVAVLGGLGAVLRFTIDRAVSRRLAGAFPTGILVVNLSGAFLLGLLGGLSLGPTTAVLVGVGLLGSYTTFSTWMLQTLELGEGRRSGLAVANIAVSAVLGLAAAGLGWWLGTAF
jgi:fluoride exporter